MVESVAFALVSQAAFASSKQVCRCQSTLSRMQVPT